MRKALRVLSIIFVFILLFSGCGKSEPVAKGEEAIFDKNIENGIGIMGTNSLRDGMRIYKHFRYNDTVSEDTVPLWRLAQWGTKYNISENFIEEVDGDNYIIKDDTKEFIVNPKTGQYSLNCNAAMEYPEPRVYGQEWLHWITVQNVVDITTMVGDLNHATATLDFEITACENYMSESEFDEGLHSALFQWVFVVKNNNPDSLDYNQYIWVNIPYFDARYGSFKEDAFLDYGKEDKSDTFIFTASSQGYLGDKEVKVGQRRKIAVDLLPYIERALEVIKTLPQNIDSEYPILQNTTLMDLVIQQFYIGWEVPGTFRADATIYSNSLMYDKKQVVI